MPSDAPAAPVPDHPGRPSPAQPSDPAQPPPSTPPQPRRYKLTLAYDGTLFHGWQKQVPPPPLPPLRTVAGELEAAMVLTMKQPIRLVGASRTDAGVHARGQVAHFDAATRLPLERMAEAINARLARDVEVVAAEQAAPDFDAIAHARRKRYRYRFFNTHRRPLEKRHHVHHCWTPLDLARMRDAAARLVGTHDFLGFAAASDERVTSVRTIFACGVEVDETDPRGREVHVVVEGDGFLYNMVRIIAGTLFEVGRGRLPPDVVDRVIAARDRTQAGPTLPPGGLWLEWVRYD